MAAGRALTTRVLLIEPDEGLAAALAAALAAEHAIVITASAEEALETLRGPSRPELVILDAEAPEGFDVLQAIKGGNDTRQIPTIVFVGASDSAAADRAWDLNANCVIRKAERSEFEPVFPKLSRFWLVAAVLPRKLQVWAARG